MLKNTAFITILAGILVFGVGCLDPNAAAAPGAANQPPAEDPFDPDRPPTAKTLYLMADMLAAQGKDAEAERLYRRIVGQYPEFLPAYNELAALLMRQRRVPEAMKILEAGTELQPDDPVLLNNTGMCWLIRKRYQNALDCFTKATAIVPENTRYRSNMATALALMGRYDEALSLYRQILPEQQARENVRILKENIKTIQ